MPTYARADVTLVEGEGSWVTDSDGRRYLDFAAGIAVVALGHRHPAPLGAAQAQLDRLWHVSNLYWTEPMARLADLLSERLGGAQAFFCNSGTEAIEAAIKYARKSTGKPGIVSLENSFHGRTMGALAATGQPAKHQGFEPLLPGVTFARLNDIASLEAAVGPDTGLVLVEPVQGEGGVNPAEPEFFHGVRQLCDERGLLMIVDEVQTGFGRTGRWFGFEHFGVRPDVVTLAKAMGNGVPVGACWARVDVAAAFEPGDHGSTYSGTAIATAAVLAVIDEMRRIDAPRLADERGARLRAAVAALPGVVGVRGLGLLLAAELEPERSAKAVYEAALARGLVTNAVTPSALRLAPPLTVSDGEIDEAVAILGEVLA
jgi:predicted acetylornithine/succinylornithine family transaminase